MEYTLKIDQFEGPLDLLLHLIKESKMDIFDLKIEIIVDQYLKYINKMEELNLNVASNYLVMASELIELKSKLLLPRYDEEEEEENTEQNLINRLIEYQRYKDLTTTFKEMEQLRRELHTKLPESVEAYSEAKTFDNMNITLDDLMEAFQRFLERKKEEQPISTKITKKEISVEERRASIRKILKERKRVNFFELFEFLTKEYVVATFLAVLEMARKLELKIYQENTFDDIICEVI